MSTGTRRFPYRQDWHFALTSAVCSSRDIKLAEPCQALNLMPRGSGQSRTKVEDRPFPFKSTNTSFEHTYLKKPPHHENPPQRTHRCLRCMTFIFNFKTPIVACFIITAPISKPCRYLPTLEPSKQLLPLPHLPPDTCMAHPSVYSGLDSQPPAQEPSLITLSKVRHPHGTWVPQ